MKRIVLVILFCISFLSIQAQSIDLPDYEFKTAEDYTTYAKDIVKAIDWLAATEPGQYLEKRKEVAAFVMQWMTGTPTVTLDINANIVTFVESPDLFLLFLGGWSSYAIENNDKDKIKGNLAGLAMVMDYYQKFRSSMKRDKNIEKYIKLKSKGKLEAFVKKNA